VVRPGSTGSFARNGQNTFRVDLSQVRALSIIVVLRLTQEVVMSVTRTAEQRRLEAAREQGVQWKKWGPYLSERQWGTVREDYSDGGDAWSYFTHDQARSRAYRWGEDGLLGISDDHQLLCFAPALWNGHDAILKERCFGLTNAEGNHGEDVKEYYFYVDSTPTHSYMNAVYKYPQAAFPYNDLVTTNRQRSRTEFEYELLDTGIFDDDRYFDVVVEYAKTMPDDLLIRITAHNRGPDSATLHILPTVWFRNTWSWGQSIEKPTLRGVMSASSPPVIQVSHPTLGDRFLYCEGNPEFLFTENETNTERLWNQPNPTPYVKDGINDAVVYGQSDKVNPNRVGTKAAIHYVVEIDAGKSATVRLRLTNLLPDQMKSNGNSEIFGQSFDQFVELRRREADEFYASITPATTTEDEARVMRQALAGMLWSKQYYYYDVSHWLDEHRAHPLIPGQNRQIRNRSWFHMANNDIISMPDKWEYPWYAAWDLAFHAIALSMVDIDFAKSQLDIMLREPYLHPNGQLPAYEWNFGDVNPPVHAWATYFVYNIEKELYGRGDIAFLEHAFNKLAMNFTWWVNRKDPSGRNVFEGGFLGLDNIGVFDRSAALPTGGYLDQADGTAWMALFCQNLLQIAVELAKHDSAFAELIPKYVEHFLWISSAMDRMGENQDEMWDEEDGFFYDLLRLPDGSTTHLKVRSLVGLLPICAVTVFDMTEVNRFPDVMERLQSFAQRHPELATTVHPLTVSNKAGRRILSLVEQDKLRRVLTRMLDENEFFGPYGIRAISRYHLDHPYSFYVHGDEYRVSYLPAESDTGMFGGNSNWRGPVWMPINALLVRALAQLYTYYGDDFTVECPTGSGRQMNLLQVSQELVRRLTSIFIRNAEGRRPVYGGAEKFQTDPNWRDLILFHEYFHGDNGAGLGASHQTGWTGGIAKLIQLFRSLNAAQVFQSGLYNVGTLTSAQQEEARSATTVRTSADL
jgi:hypothetical protein